MFILPGAKFAKKVDVASALSQAIATSKGPAAASKAKSSCEAFQKLRSAVHEPPNTAKAAADLRKYLCAVEHAQKHIENTNALDIALHWANGFDIDDDAKSGDLTLDRAATAFNLGVCEARVAVDVVNTAMGDECRTAARHFRSAASYFKMIIDMPTPAAHSTDLSKDVLQALSLVMLGNGQQMFCKHLAETGAAKPGQLAIFVAGAADFYGYAADICRTSGIAGGPIDKVVGMSARALKDMLNSEAQFLHGKGFHAVMDLGHAIPQLRKAVKATEQALQVAESLPDNGVLSWIGLLKENMIGELRQRLIRAKEMRDEAEELNRKIYFRSEVASVPPVVGKKTLNVENMQAVIDAELETVVKLVGNFP